MLFECTSKDKARIVEHLKTKYGAEAVSYVSAQFLYRKIDNEIKRNPQKTDEIEIPL